MVLLVSVDLFASTYGIVAHASWYRKTHIVDRRRLHTFGSNTHGSILGSRQILALTFVLSYLPEGLRRFGS
jgi:hypothetical protein